MLKNAEARYKELVRAGEVGGLASKEKCQGWGGLLRSAIMGKTSHVGPTLKGSGAPGETGRRG